MAMVGYIVTFYCDGMASLRRQRIGGTLADGRKLYDTQAETWEINR